MGQALSNLMAMMVGQQLRVRHALPASRGGLPSRLEDMLVGMFSRRVENRVYVHWGAYESGKSRAAYNAAFRLQQMTKPVMLLQGYHMNFATPVQKWLHESIHIDDDTTTLSEFYEHDIQPLVIVDHADIVLKKQCAQSVYGALVALGTPTLVIVSAWEHAVDLQALGARVIGQPGFARWTKDELRELYESMTPRLLSCGKKLCAEEQENLMECAVIAGSPGILVDDALENRQPNLRRAMLINAEWENGISALRGGGDKGVTGRFPDKSGVFHWD